MMLRSFALGAAILCLACSLVGCAAPLVVSASAGLLQEGASAYVNGQLQTAHKTPLDQSQEAMRRTLRELHLPILVDRTGDISGYLASKETDGDEISIRLEKVSCVATMIKVRIGLFGDQATSRLLIQEWERQLEQFRALPETQQEAEMEESERLSEPQNP